MRAKHHQLVFEARVRSRNLADDVEGIQIVVVEPVLHVDLEDHRYTLLDRAHDATVMLRGHDQSRNRGRRIRLARHAVVCEHCPTVAATGRHRSQRALVDEEPRAQAIELLRPGEVSAASTAPAPSTRLSGGYDLKVRDGVELVLRIPMPLSVEVRSDVHRSCCEHPLPPQPAAVLREVADAVDLYEHDLTRGRTLRTRRPRRGIGNHFIGARCDDLGTEALVRPTTSERTPRLEPRVAYSPCFHPLYRPLARGARVG